MVCGLNGKIGPGAVPLVVQEFSSEKGSAIILPLQMEESRAKVQVKRQEIVKLETVLKMVSIVIGYHGKNALLVVVKDSERGSDDVIIQDQRVEAKHVLVNQFIEKFAIVQIVQLMVIGEVGSLGNHAPCHVDLDIRKDTEDVTLQNNNLVDQSVEDRMSKKELAR
jgi:hypothetical protein